MSPEPTSRQAIPIRWAAQNLWDFWADYNTGVWEPETHQIIDKYVTPDSTYVDIGAWIGPTVLWAAPHAARVIAIEPDHVARACLITNVENYPNVEIVDSAIGPENGTGKFVAQYREGFGSSMSRLDMLPNHQWWAHDTYQEVETITLPTLFDRYAIRDVSLVKMDIEGGEAEVLETVCPFLADLNIPFLCSLHKDWWATTVQPEWFDCFTHVIGEWGVAAALLAIP